MILLVLSISPVKYFSIFVYVSTGVFIPLAYFPSLDYFCLKDYLPYRCIDYDIQV